jgi:ADP-ribose pyrophosphatase
LNYIDISVEMIVMLQPSNSSSETLAHKAPLSSRTVYEGFVTLTEELLTTPKGPYPYVTVHTRPLSVIILPQRRDGKWLVTKEWRYPIKRYVHSFPGGLVDHNETPLQSGRRELLEETGFDSDNIELLGTCFPLPGLLHQTMSVVLARDIRLVQEPRRDSVEDRSVEIYTMEELQKMLRSSSDVDAMGLAALAVYWINTK